MPLQNRVMPTGEIVASSARGTLFGNRGGKLHNPKTKKLHPTKRWGSKTWICCELEFKDRKRKVMGDGYTELFFCDEVTALAAGHRPCFECRRKDAKAFSKAWGEAAKLDSSPKAADMDGKLHEERLDNKNKKTWTRKWGDLPNGVLVLHNDAIVARYDGRAFQWSHDGYSRPVETLFPTAESEVQCLTPPSIQAVLKSGYRPRWHPSAATV